MSASASVAAFRFSFDALAKVSSDYAVSRGLKPEKSASIYFWTVTTVKVQAIQVTCKKWSNFLRAFSAQCKRNQKPLQMIRVFELHPGEEDGVPYWNGEKFVQRYLSHGLHIHFVVPVFFNIRYLKRLLFHYGFGRTNVKRIPFLQARNYLGKYLSKESFQRPGALKGLRLWQCVGMKAIKTRASDIVIESFGGWFVKKWVESEDYRCAVHQYLFDQYRSGPTGRGAPDAIKMLGAHFHLLITSPLSDACPFVSKV